MSSSEEKTTIPCVPSPKPPLVLLIASDESAFFLAWGTACAKSGLTLESPSPEFLKSLKPYVSAFQRERPLTPKQFEILRMVAHGKSSAEIARELFLSPHTVKSHIKKIRGRLLAHNMAAAVGKAYRLGILSVFDED